MMYQFTQSMRVENRPYRALFLILIIPLLTGCGTARQTDTTGIETRVKFDQNLISVLQEWDEAEIIEPLYCFIQLDDGPDVYKLHELEQAGLELVSITDSILAVRGLPEAIKKAAVLDYVESIHLRQMDNPG